MALVVEVLTTEVKKVVEVSMVMGHCGEVWIVLLLEYCWLERTSARVLSRQDH